MEQETNILSRLNYIKRVLDEVEIRARLDKNQDGTLVLLNPEFINDVPGIQDLYELAGSFNSPLLGYRGTQSSLIDAFFMSSDLKASTAILNLVMFGNYSQIQPEIAEGISAWLELQRRVKSEIAEAGDHTTAPGTRNQPEKRSSFNDTEKRVIAEAIKVGWIEAVDDDHYIWKLEHKAALSYFIACINNKVDIIPKIETSKRCFYKTKVTGNVKKWSLWENAFGLSGLRKDLSQLQRDTVLYSEKSIAIYKKIHKFVNDHKSGKGA